MQRWAPGPRVAALKARRPEKYGDRPTVAIVNSVPQPDAEGWHVDLGEIARRLAEETPKGLKGFSRTFGDVIDSEAVELSAPN